LIEQGFFFSGTILGFEDHLLNDPLLYNTGVFSILVSLPVGKFLSGSGKPYKPPLLLAVGRRLTRQSFPPLNPQEEILTEAKRTIADSFLDLMQSY
jgi:hypothetical protein